MQAIKDYESNKWKVIGQKLGKPAKVRVFSSYYLLLFALLLRLRACVVRCLVPDRYHESLLASLLAYSLVRLLSVVEAS
jgi:hypothetical protein